MPQTSTVPEQVKSAPLTHQVVEQTTSGMFVVAAFDRPEDAELFASLAPGRRARVDPHWVALQEMGRVLHRPADVTEHLAGRDA